MAMNMTTTALFAFVASASEKGFPSTAVSWKAGAAAPIAGLSARATPAKAASEARDPPRYEAFSSWFLSLNPPESPRRPENSLTP